MVDPEEFISDIDFECKMRRKRVLWAIAISQDKDAPFYQFMGADNHPNFNPKAFISPMNLMRIAALKGYKVLIYAKEGSLSSSRAEQIKQNVNRIIKRDNLKTPNIEYDIFSWYLPNDILYGRDNFGGLWNYPNSGKDTFCLYFSDTMAKPIGPKEGKNLTFNFYYD